MKYNLKDIGERLRTERKKKGWSQNELINRLQENNVYIGRNTLSQIENGSQDFNNFSLGLLIVLCQEDFFNCEIGYLLCEYDCRTGRNTDIQKETGLSDDAINGLYLLHKPINPRTMDSVQISRYDIIALNIILEDFYNKMLKTSDHEKYSEKTNTLLNCVGQYIDSGSAAIDISQNGKLSIYSSDEIAEAICNNKITLLLNQLKEKYSLGIIGKRIANKEYFEKLYNDFMKDFYSNKETDKK